MLPILFMSSLFTFISCTLLTSQQYVFANIERKQKGKNRKSRIAQKRKRQDEGVKLLIYENNTAYLMHVKEIKHT